MTTTQTFLACVTLASCAQIEDPCKTKSRVVADDKYCDKYWECDNGQSVQYDCPNGLVFAGKHRGVTEGCDYPWRSNYCEYPKTQINPPIGTEHCDWLYGIFGHETSCTRYWTCWNGTATEQLCIGGLLYNENAHSCDWPENVDGCQKHRERSKSKPTGIALPLSNYTSEVCSIIIMSLLQELSIEGGLMMKLLVQHVHQATVHRRPFLEKEPGSSVSTLEMRKAGNNSVSTDNIYLHSNICGIGENYAATEYRVTICPP
ncbi:hypothetical protein ACJJTC_001807 [Scirpophaga incertulas]